MKIASMENKKGQACINASLQKMSSQIDSCSVSSTKQCYHTFEYEGCLTTGQKIKLERPIQPTDVYIDICNNTFCIGNIDSGGNFTAGEMKGYLTSNTNTFNWQKSSSRISDGFYACSKLCLGVYCADVKQLNSTEYRYYGGNDCIAFYDVCGCPVYNSDCVKSCCFRCGTSYVGNTKTTTEINEQNILEFYAPNISGSYFLNYCNDIRDNSINCVVKRRELQEILYQCFYKNNKYVKLAAGIPLLSTLCLYTTEWKCVCKTTDLYGCESCVPLKQNSEDSVLVSLQNSVCNIGIYTDCFSLIEQEDCKERYTLAPSKCTQCISNYGCVVQYLHGTEYSRSSMFPAMSTCTSIYTSDCDGYDVDINYQKYCGVFKYGTKLGDWNSCCTFKTTLGTACSYICYSGCLAKKGALLNDNSINTDIVYYNFNGDKIDGNLKYNKHSSFNPNNEYIGCVYTNCNCSFVPAGSEEAYSPLSCSVAYSKDLYNCLYKKALRKQQEDNMTYYAPAKVHFGDICYCLNLCLTYNNNVRRCYTYRICSNPLVFERFTKYYTVCQTTYVLTDFSKCCLKFKFYYL